MHSVKRGRGPSAFGGVGNVLVAIFGVIWTAAMASGGAPGFFVAFGVVFVLLAIAGGIYNFYNATARNRVSDFDIVRSSAEPDPFARGAATTSHVPAKDPVDGFCPFCGTALSPEFAFCPKCGKAVPPAT